MQLLQNLRAVFLMVGAHVGAKIRGVGRGTAGAGRPENQGHDDLEPPERHAFLPGAGAGSCLGGDQSSIRNGLPTYYSGEPPRGVPMLRIELATTPNEIEQVRGLFRDYAAWLGYDLCFQGFEQELAGLPGRYAPPDGRLYLATDDGQPVGCIALRGLDGGICEMKRLYVRPSHRTRGLGRTLAERLIREAAAIGYERMRLDTLPVMGTARNLYAALGFREIPPYYSNPIQGAIYMELALAPSGLSTPGAGFQPTAPETGRVSGPGPGAPGAGSAAPDGAPRPPRRT